jgi:2-keto-4-pentenoate hydratase
MTNFNDAATLFLTVRRGASPRLDGLPAALRPETESDAYAIQQAVVTELGGIGGWKVGSASPTATHFTCAPLPAGTVLDGPLTIQGSDRGVEAEIAVRLGRDLPPREAPYTMDEIRTAIASVHPAIEVLESRFVDLAAAGALSGLADSLSNHSLVLGPAIADWEQVDLTNETVSLLVDGVEIKRGAANPGGEMLRLVVWLANAGTLWAGGLRAGQVITTGSWTGKDYAQPGAEVVARFAHCGDATLRFAS